MRAITMASPYKGKDVWEVRIGGETALYIGSLEEVQEKAKTHNNYLHDDPSKPIVKSHWNSGYPISKIERVGELDG